MTTLTVAQALPDVAQAITVATTRQITVAQTLKDTKQLSGYYQPALAFVNQILPDVSQWARTAQVFPFVTPPPVSRTLVVIAESRTLAIASS